MKVEMTYDQAADVFSQYGVDVSGLSLDDLPIRLKQVVQPPREAAGHDWRRRAGCLSLADRR
jgi:hypothetical protein